MIVSAKRYRELQYALLSEESAHRTTQGQLRKALRGADTIWEFDSLQEAYRALREARHALIGAQNTLAQLEEDNASLKAALTVLGGAVVKL